MGAENARVHEEANRKALKGEAVTYEWQVSHNTGDKYFQTTLSPIYNESNEVEGLIGVGRDITDIRIADKALKHSHELMKYIIEHNQNTVAIFDRNMNYVYVSQRFLNENFVPVIDIIGQNHYALFPDLPERWKTAHQDALNGIVSRNDEDNLIRENGKVDWIRWECRPWYGADGSVGGIILYTEVITEKKKKEEEIKRLMSSSKF